MKSKKTFSIFRKAALAEGISFLLLLGVAMPLKYAAGYPMAVMIAGSIHGALFVLFMILLYLVKDQYNKSLGWAFKAFIASIIPFGTFILDKEWKKEEMVIGADMESTQKGIS
jgi:integral membrane protein